MDVALAAAYERLLSELSRRLGAGYAELLLHVDSHEPARLIVFPRAVRQAAAPNNELLGRLTGRKRDVLRLLSDGLMNAQIAERLNVQESTVKFHIQNIFQKFDVTNRTEAAQIYFREGQKA